MHDDVGVGKYMLMSVTVLFLTILIKEEDPSVPV
jgi:hypothetical protein